jgi:hypothetical protein
VARVPTRKRGTGIAADTAAPTTTSDSDSLSLTSNGDPAASAFAWLFLLALLLLSGRAGAVTSTSHLRMLSSHLRTMRSHLGLARPLSHLMRPVSSASSPGSFAGMHFSLVSPSGSHVPLISGLELVPVCSGLITCSCSLKITFSYVPRFVSTFSRSRSSCSPESLLAALALPHAFALVE